MGEYNYDKFREFWDAINESQMQSKTDKQDVDMFSIDHYNNVWISESTLNQIANKFDIKINGAANIPDPIGWKGTMLSFSAFKNLFLTPII